LDLAYIKMPTLWVHRSSKYIGRGQSFEDYNFCSSNFDTWLIDLAPENPSNLAFIPYDNSATLYIPGSNEHAILDVESNISEAYREFEQNYSNKATVKGHHFSCFTPKSGKGIGVKVKTPDGKIYFFSKAKAVHNFYHQIKHIDNIRNDTYTPVDFYLLPTKVEDAHGNYVEYSYGEAASNVSVYNRGPDDDQIYLEKITSNDNREITINYENFSKSKKMGYVLNRRIKSITANNKTWNYEYDEFHPKVKGRDDTLEFYSLSKVIQPDSTFWEFKGLTPKDFKYFFYLDDSGTETEAYLHPIFNAFPNNAISSSSFHENLTGSFSYENMKDTLYKGLEDYTGTIKSPTGLEVNYTFRSTYHGISGGIKRWIENFENKNIKFKGKDVYNLFKKYHFHTWSVVNKIVKVDNESLSWSFKYSENVLPYYDGEYYPNSWLEALEQSNSSYQTEMLPNYIVGDDIYDYKVTRITNPDGSYVDSIINRNFNDASQNKVIFERYFRENALIKEVKYEFEPLRKIGNSGVLVSNDYLNDWQVVLTKINEIIYYTDGESDEYSKLFSSFDPLAKPLIEQRSYNNQNKYIKRQLLNSKGRKVNNFGLLEREDISNDGVNYEFVKGYDYRLTDESRALVADNYYYLNSDTPSETFSYNSNGLLSRVELNDNLIGEEKRKYIAFSSYKRGKPSVTTLSARYETKEISSSQSVNNEGLIDSFTDLNQNTTYYEYDSLGRLAAIDLSDDILFGNWLDTLIIWNHSDNTRTIKRCMLNSERNSCVDEPVFETVEDYDSLLRLKILTFKDNVNNITRYQNFTYDYRNLPTFTSQVSDSQTESKGVTTYYDALGRKEKVSKSGLGFVTYEYLSGNRIKVTDAGKNTSNDKDSTTTTYQAFGSPSYDVTTKIESPEGVTTDIDVDVFGLVHSITQSGHGKSVTETRKYDANKQLCLIQRPDVGNTLLKHNALGQVIWQKQGVTNTDCVTTKPTNSTTLAYDNLGAIKSITYPDLTPNVTYSYDNNGNLLSIKSGDVEHVYNYNNQNLLEDELLFVDSNNALSIDYEYNALQHRNSITYPDGTYVNFAPNGFGEATQAIYKVGSIEYQVFAKDAVYYPSGQINSFTYGNGVTHKTELDPTSLLPSSITDKRNSTNLVNLSYTYDNNMNVTSITNGVQSTYSLTNLTYDGLDRLISTTGGADTEIGNSLMTYDAIGNIKTYESKDRQLSYTYEESTNRLTSVGGLTGKYGSIEYDGRGNVINNGSFDLSYNLANQMKSANGNSYLYDGHNRRVKKTNSDGHSEYSMYSKDGTLLYREKGSASGNGTNYIYLGKKLVAKYGDVVPQTLAESRQHYRPFGETINEPKDDVGYTGHKFDKDINLSYMQARYYDPVIGRFYSNDPVGFTGEVDTFNRYSYVANNPYKYIDPNGEAKVSFGVSAELVVVGGAKVGGSVSFDTQTLEISGKISGGPRVGLSAGIGVSGSITDSGESPASNSVKVGDTAVNIEGAIGPVSVGQDLVTQNSDGTVGLGNSTVGGGQGLVDVKPQLKFGASVGIESSINATSSIIPDAIKGVGNAVNQVKNMTMHELGGVPKVTSEERLND
jgi:RHS repeat-associated protein